MKPKAQFRDPTSAASIVASLAVLAPVVVIFNVANSGGEVFWLLLIGSPFILGFAIVLHVMVGVALNPAGPDGRNVFGIPLAASIVLLIVLGPLSLVVFAIMYLVNRTWRR